MPLYAHDGCGIAAISFHHLSVTTLFRDEPIGFAEIMGENR